MQTLIHTTKPDPEDEGSIYLSNIVNTVHIHMVQPPKN
jgi:hypothetical protein